MKKVKHTLGDGTEHWVWEDKFDGVTFGFDCSAWTKEDAIKSFKYQVLTHIENNKRFKRSIKQ